MVGPEVVGGEDGSDVEDGGDVVDCEVVGGEVGDVVGVLVGGKAAVGD